MMKIRLTDLNDWSIRLYLDKNPEFANQLVATLNQVNGFSPNQLAFHADSCCWTYDFWFSSNYEIDKEAFRIYNDQIGICSTRRDDLLNVHYYQQLNNLANNHPIEKWIWNYFPQDQVLQLESYSWSDTYLNIKLTKPIDQYNQNQLKAIGKFMTNAIVFIINDNHLNWDQFDAQWKRRLYQNYVKDIGIVVNFNNFANPQILVRWLDENNNDQYKNDCLKQVLKPDSELLKFLNKANFQAHFQPYIDQKLINSLKSF